MKIQQNNAIIPLLIKYIIICFCIIVLIHNFSIEQFTDSTINLTIFSIGLLSLGIFYFSLNNTFGLIIFYLISYFNYSILMRRYIIKTSSNLYLQIDDINIHGIGVTIILVFLIIVLLFLKKNFYKTKRIYIKNKENKYIVLIISIILIIIFLFAFGRPDIDGGRGEPSALYEYSIIFFILGFYYSGEKKIYRYTLLIILVCFGLQNIIYGGRITAIQLIMIVYVMFIHGKISIKYFIPFALVLFVYLNGIGTFRGSMSLDKNSLEIILNNLKNNMLTLDTADSAYFTSLTFVIVKEKISFLERIELFKNFCLSIFFGGSVTNSNLAYYTRNYIFHYFGGVLPFFFYFWLGWIGIFIPSVIVAKIINYSSKLSLIENDFPSYLKLIMVYLLVTIPRWYLYSPTPLFRGLLLFTLVYLFFKLVHNLTIKK